MAEQTAFYLYGVSPAGSVGSGMSDGLFTIRVGKVEALVKEVPLAQFGEEALARNLRDPKWLERQLWEHERVLEEVMQRTTVLPMKFGAIFTSSQRLFERLEAHEMQLHQMLDQLAGQEEWGVKGFCDRSAVEDWVRQGSERLKALEAPQAAGQPAGTAFLLKKKMEGVLREEVDLELAKQIQTICETLSPYSTQTRLNQPLGRGLTELATGRQGEMVLNVAFLVLKERSANFAEALERLNEAVRPRGLELERVGPFPPYNFSDLRLKDEEELEVP